MGAPILIDPVFISERCTEYRLAPTVFDRWQTLRFIGEFMARDYGVRLHGLLRYVTPTMMLSGQSVDTLAERFRTRALANEHRRKAHGYPSGST